MTKLERFLSNEKRRLELDAFLNSITGSQAVDVLKDMHRPSRGDVIAQDANRVVLAASEHDYQAGWHDCIRAFASLTVEKKKQTPETVKPFDDSWVRELMEKRGTPLRDPTMRTSKSKSKTK